MTAAYLPEPAAPDPRPLLVVAAVGLLALLAACTAPAREPAALVAPESPRATVRVVVALAPLPAEVVEALAAAGLSALPLPIVTVEADAQGGRGRSGVGGATGCSWGRLAGLALAIAMAGVAAWLAWDWWRGWWVAQR